MFYFLYKISPSSENMLYWKVLTSLIMGFITFMVLKRIKFKDEYAEAMNRKRKYKEIRSRKMILEKLKTEKFDILVIGGGITGSGCSLDCASRGLKTAMIERYDFGAETSSKSTKLLHGGLRYLLKAFSECSISQLILVIKGLRERKKIMKMAPYLTNTVKILIPIYKSILIPYYFLAGKLYDWLSWDKSLGRSYILSKSQTLLYYCNLPKNNLVNSIAYYDGMMNDGRLNVMVAKTASIHGAIISNYVEFLSFKKSKNGQIESAICKDVLSNEEIEIFSKIYISAVGCFTDIIRSKNISLNSKILVASSGTHIVLDTQFGPENVGLVDTHTKDGRVAFILPWKGFKLVGATEIISDVTATKCPTMAEIEFLMEEAQKYSLEKIKIENVKAVWSAVRPLLSNSHKIKTESIVRNYSIVDDGNGLISVTGGKWTIFRKMAEETVNLAIKKYGLKQKNECITDKLEIVGSRKFSRNFYCKVSRILDVDIDYAKHLTNYYGTNACKLKPYLLNYPEKISNKYPFTAAEVIYCVEHEYACTSLDIINNRFEVGFYDLEEAYKMKGKIDKILESYFNSKGEKYLFESQYCDKILKSIGLGLIFTPKLT